MHHQRLPPIIIIFVPKKEQEYDQWSLTTSVLRELRKISFVYIVTVHCTITWYCRRIEWVSSWPRDRKLQGTEPSWFFSVAKYSQWCTTEWEYVKLLIKIHRTYSKNLGQSKIHSAIYIATVLLINCCGLTHHSCSIRSDCGCYLFLSVCVRNRKLQFSALRSKFGKICPSWYTFLKTGLYMTQNLQDDFIIGMFFFSAGISFMWNTRENRTFFSKLWDWFLILKF